MNNKNIVIRVDASIEIGSGHVMRCLTLATALRERGAKITFICRDFPGNRASYIRVQGFECRTLRSPEAGCPSGMTEPPHAKWLGTSWQEDADETASLIGPGRPEWLVVDHYGIDYRWEGRLRSQVQKIMVIDDLLDRKHDCDLILDQTLGREASAYSSLVPDVCKQLMGPSYALLRPEFARLREASLRRREKPVLRNILVSLGGVDKDNLTVSVLRELRKTSLPTNCEISVVMGSASPWREEVRQEAASMPWPTTVSVDVSDMAERMAASDLAIGAAGTTSWERCCLGLPTILFVLADNQREVARSLERAGAVVVADCASVLPQRIAGLCGPDQLRQSSIAAAAVTDGRGLAVVVDAMKITTVVLRKMTSDDLAMVLVWRNHPDIRRYMYNTHEITMEEHQRWFATASQDNNRALLIFEQDGIPSGFVQFSPGKSGESADWGFYASPEARKGAGSQLGEVAVQYAFEKLDIDTLFGEVIAGNERSISFHERLGFQRVGEQQKQVHAGAVPFRVLGFGLSREDWKKMGGGCHG